MRGTVRAFSEAFWVIVRDGMYWAIAELLLASDHMSIS